MTAPVLSGHLDLRQVTDTSVSNDTHEAVHGRSIDTSVKNVTGDETPHSLFVQPVFSELQNSSSDIVGLLYTSLPWDRYLVNLLPEDVFGVICVVRNSCGPAFTYALDGKTVRVLCVLELYNVCWTVDLPFLNVCCLQATYLGGGDLHDFAFDAMKIEVPFNSFEDTELALNTTGHCLHTFELYPSELYAKDYKDSLPNTLTAVAAMMIFVMGAAFFTYDKYVHKRNVKVVDRAARSNAIVTSLFPAAVASKLLAAENGATTRSGIPRSQLESFLDGDDDGQDKDEAIAELFPETTILFADLAGFTAWSSTREPTQVFLLLETLYQALDKMAKSRRVFKVETIGDCYVAVTGLPKPQKNHAVIMARFARDCIQTMKRVGAELEVKLGPGTSELAMRVGLHSGPVTAGVLRGEKARFQLFGDTMNTAARMESNGERNRIHVSEATAEMLCDAGKNKWVQPRLGKIVAKGKGEMQTYWIEMRRASSDSNSICSTNETDSTTEGPSEEQHPSFVNPEIPARTQRLIKWNTEVLLGLLREVVARRNTRFALGSDCPEEAVVETKAKDLIVLDEVKDVISFPRNDDKAACEKEEPLAIELDPEVAEQLREFISDVASM